MEKLSAALNGSLASKMLIVGYDYDIFTRMKEPITVKDLAQKVECDERYLQEWCEGLHLSGKNYDKQPFIVTSLRYIIIPNKDTLSVTNKNQTAFI